MIIIPVEIVRLEMDDFDVRANTAHIIVHYVADKPHRLEKTIQPENTEALAGSLLTEIRASAKKENAQRAVDEEDFLIIKFVLDEEELERRVKAFLDRVAGRVKGLRQTRVATGYLDKLNSSKKLVVEFSS